MDITKVFDIQGSPKTAEELEKLRQSFKPYLNKLNIIRLISIIIITVLAVFYLSKHHEIVFDIVIPVCLSILISGCFVLIYAFREKAVLLVGIVFIISALVSTFYMLEKTGGVAIAPLHESLQTSLNLIIIVLILIGFFCFQAVVSFKRFCIKDAFQPITPDNASNIINWCKTDAIIAAYQNAVAAQERPLLVGEHDAMERWIKSGKQIAEKEADYKKTLNPIAYEGENK